MRSVGALVLVLGIAGCAGAGDRAGNGTTTVTVERVGDERAPALSLPQPPPGPQRGGHYLARVEPVLQTPFATYLENCRTLLAPDHPLNDPTLTVVLSIVVDGGGAVDRMAVQTSSGNQDFDNAAIEIVRDAKLPAPEPRWLGDDGNTELRWRFSRDRRQAGRATASLLLVQYRAKVAVPQLLSAGRFADAAARLVGGDSADTVALLDEVAGAVVASSLLSRDDRVKELGTGWAAVVRHRRIALALEVVAPVGFDPGVRAQQFRAIGAQRSSTGVGKGVVRAALHEGKTSAGELAAAARALADLGGADIVVRDAGAALVSKEPGDRARALAMVQQVAAPKLSRALVRLSRDRRAPPSERAAAVAALVPLAAAGDAAARRQLARELRSADVSRRRGAIRALAELGTGGTGAAVESAARRLLTDRDDRVRVAAVRALVHGARSTLVARALSGEGSAVVLRSFAQAIAKHGTGARAPSVVESVLLRAAAMAAVSRDAARALWRLPGRRSAAVVQVLRGSRDAVVGDIAMLWRSDSALLAVARGDRAAASILAAGELARRWPSARAVDLFAALLAKNPDNGAAQLRLAVYWLLRDGHLAAAQLPR